jgi:hypothetical protein
VADEQQTPLPLEGEESEQAAVVEVPKTDFEALQKKAAELESRLQAAEIEKVRLEERAKAPETQAPPAAPAPTREQLQEHVDNGTITQAQMDTELARQLREELKKELSTELRQEFTVKDQQRVVQDQFDAYVKVHPDVKVEGSDDLRRVRDEIQSLVKLGYPHDLRTEVMAMRMAFGPAERIEETTSQRLDTHRETGGAGSAPATGAPTGAAWEKGLNDGQIAAFRKQLDRNVYPSEDDAFFKKVVTRARTDNIARKAS